MKVITRTIPDGYTVRKWGHVGGREMWWHSSSQAYLERRIILRYNPQLNAGDCLVYFDGNRYTLLDKINIANT